MHLLLAALLLLQDKGAEDNLKRIEEGIEKAKSVRVKVRCDAHFIAQGVDSPYRVNGLMVLGSFTR